MIHPGIVPLTIDVGSKNIHNLSLNDTYHILSLNSLANKSIDIDINDDNDYQNSNPIIKSTAIKYLLKFKDYVPELFDENNNLDIDKFYSMAKEAIKKSGQFEFMDIIFNETDIDKLYAYIKPTVASGISA